MCKFASPVAARYVQFVCDEMWNATCLSRFTISGCPIGKKSCPIAKSLNKAGAREISIDQSGFSRRGKLYCPDFCPEGIEIRQLFLLEMTLNMHEKGFTIKQYQFAK